MSHGDSEKDKGNAAFYKGDYDAALKHYDKAIENAGSGAVAALFSNKAAALIKLKKYDLGIQQCCKGLAAPVLTPALESKIYLRMANAYESQGRIVAAMEALQKCDPSPAISAKMEELRGKAYTLDGNAKDEGPERIDSTAFFMDMLGLGNAKSTGHICSAQLCDLKPIFIDQLRLGVVNVGRALVCRTVGRSGMINTLLSTAVEDPRGKQALFSVYNFCSPMKAYDLPIGTYLAVKEPWYRKGMRVRVEFYFHHMDSDAGLPIIKVDNIADLVYLEQTHSLLSNLTWSTNERPSSPVSGLTPGSWESFEKRGDKLLSDGNYELAVVAFTDAIELKRKVAPPKEVADLLVSRAAAYLGDEKPEDTLWDCRSALFVQSGHINGTYQMAKGHAHLASYEEAKDLLEKSPHTTRPEFQAEISRLNRLIREQKFGDYDLKSLLKEAAASETPRLDHADFNGGVHVQWISREKGNGLVALRDFAPGDLLFVNKAFEATYRSEWSENKSAHGECVRRITRRISKNNSLAKQLYRLYAGPRFERLQELEEAEFAVVPKRVDAIVSFNWIGSGDKPDERIVVDLSPYHQVPCFSFPGCGLWLLASFMNHSCVPNTGIIFTGDLIIVRAAKGIRKGEELTRSYVGAGFGYQKRQAELTKLYGFKCVCALCVCDLKRSRDNPDLDVQRKLLMDSYEASLMGRVFRSDRQYEYFNALVEAAREPLNKFAGRLAYKNRYDWDFQALCKALGAGYNGQRQFLKAAKALEMAYFASVGNEAQADDTFSYCGLSKDQLFLCFKIAENYLLACDVAKAKEYLGKMLHAAKICYGSDDMELLEMLYPELDLKNLREWLTA